MFVSAGVRRAYELAYRLVAQNVDLTLKIGFEKPDIAEQRVFCSALLDLKVIVTSGTASLF